MKRLVIIVVVMVLFAMLSIPELFARAFYVLEKPVLVDNGVVCEQRISMGVFDYNIPMTDVGGNWKIIDANGTETRNQLEVEITDSNIFTLIDVVNYEPNDPNLYGHFRVIADLRGVGEYQFTAVVTDGEGNVSLNSFSFTTVDRTPASVGCSLSRGGR